uniref:Uncharacterized protein n=1 Tax=Tetranychus urticae TaxID=32264 RepID=T1KRE1_TETUR
MLELPAIPNDEVIHRLEPIFEGYIRCQNFIDSFSTNKRIPITYSELYQAVIQEPGIQRMSISNSNYTNKGWLWLTATSELAEFRTTLPLVLAVTKASETKA